MERFAAINLDKTLNLPGYSEVVAKVAADDEKRSEFLTACLLKLGLQVNEEDKMVPSLSRLHLSTVSPPDLANLMDTLREITTIHDGEEYIKDDNDTFHLEKPSAWALSTLSNAIQGLTVTSTDEPSSNDDRDIDYNAVVKRIIVHASTPPLGKETPYFNHDAFYNNLKHFALQEKDQEIIFGKHLLYGDVVTSTNTMLEKYVPAPLKFNRASLANMSRNQQLLHRLPTGFVATANVQVAGRGRGANVWVSPAGSLMFSIVIRHSRDLGSFAPVNFIQYLAALAIVEGVKTYDSGYSRIPVKLKWPNDICESHAFHALNSASPQFPSQWHRSAKLFSFVPPQSDFRLHRRHSTRLEHARQDWRYPCKLTLHLIRIHVCGWHWTQYD